MIKTGPFRLLLTVLAMGSTGFSWLRHIVSRLPFGVRPMRRVAAWLLGCIVWLSPVVAMAKGGHGGEGEGEGISAGHAFFRGGVPAGNGGSNLPTPVAIVLVVLAVVISILVRWFKNHDD